MADKFQKRIDLIRLCPHCAMFRGTKKQRTRRARARLAEETRREVEEEAP